MYSFGVLLWEMYCGQRAWSGLQFAQLSYAVLVEERSLQFPEDCGHLDFCRLAKMCLSRQTAERPDCDVIVASLQRQISKLG